VFDAEREAREAERQEEVSDRLQDAVDDGDITAAQKTLIEKKLQELQAAREKQRTELEKWAEDNDVDVKYLMGGHGPDGNDDRLQNAVDDGDITDAQKKLIEDKADELQTARDTQRDELEQWADDNDIDDRYLMGGGMRGGHGGGRGF
jgi:cellobiose-specific phosphotransferase system component IIA